ncbi:EamA/RhaT family transporter [Rhodovulum sp. BSW8]|uniref:DMT family transporter n=1 Tax=Rhodovulum sp. BSW8 TaxID=2259645 RepID=UPI000DE26940|nr:DMT family transporter [Rhodovulum sp. BSW8]RBO53632.1 EamA/RhaT family transporter [Rhodovulum sp. BSW8]
MNPARAIGLKLISVTLFVVMSALIKAAAEHGVPPGETVFFRSLFALPVILVWLGATGQLGAGLRTGDPMGHLWRGLVGGTAMGLNFAALGILPLPEATAIGFAAPLLVVIFAAMFLGEKVRLFRLSAVALGLVGVVVVLSPRLSAFGGDRMDAAESLGAIVALAGAAAAALAQVFVRKLVQTERTSAIVFWFSVTSTVLSLFTIPLGWVVPSVWDATMLVAAGLLGGVAQICLTSAYRFAEAGLVAPFDYASMLLALVIGYFVFAEAPTPVVLTGAGLIIAAGVFIIWRERQLGLERGRARKGVTPQG